MTHWSHIEIDRIALRLVIFDFWPLRSHTEVSVNTLQTGVLADDALAPVARDQSCRADSRFVSSQWETSLQSNTVSHWLGANLESALQWATKISLRVEAMSIVFRIDWLLWYLTGISVLPRRLPNFKVISFKLLMSQVETSKKSYDKTSC